MKLQLNIIFLEKCYITRTFIIVADVMMKQDVTPCVLFHIFKIMMVTLWP